MPSLQLFAMAMEIRPLNEDSLQLLAAESMGQGTGNHNLSGLNRYRAWVTCHEAVAPNEAPSDFKHALWILERLSSVS